jgi:hypothetical protein
MAARPPPTDTRPCSTIAIPTTILRCGDTPESAPRGVGTGGMRKFASKKGG